MPAEQTLSIIKPDAVQRNYIGQIIARFEKEELKIAALRMKHLSRNDAKGFYAVHKERPFFESLLDYMTGGPVVIMVLEGENAINKNREIMGATNPEKAEDNTLRKLFGIDIEKNAVHGSDSKENAKIEIAYFFPTSTVYSR